jgi:hypothetical protein
MDAYVARAGGAAALGGAAEAVAEAVRAALRFAAHHNAFTLLCGAQAAAVEAWQQLVQASPASRCSRPACPFLDWEGLDSSAVLSRGVQHAAPRVRAHTLAPTRPVV